jgi:PKD repeat protein
MNESFADIFGAMVDREDWNIGEDVTKTSYSPSGSLRNMADPHNQGTSANSYWQPAHMSEIYLGTADNGGVHKHSGIINHAYYLYATAVTKEKAEQIFYRALFHYLSKTSQFIDLRIAVIQAATDIYGSGSQEVAEAGEAFTAVGIFDDQPTHTDNDYEPNPGQDYLLSYDTNPAETDRLWRSSTTGTNFAPLSASEMKGKVSVTDDGSAALFVSLEDKIRVLSTNPNNLDEYDLSDEAFFDNVAISKDGKRLAAISIEIDTAIYVYDFETAQWVKFTLYNPTTSEGESQAGGVLYADAIEFDNTGEYLIYDAFNQFNSDLFEDISYWDIGFIRVWDNFANDFGDGTIAKLYGSLPDNVSIGNPVFSKNSADIIAFDYFNETDNEFAILGANLSSGEVGMITTNSILGYPSFSKNDDKIAFSALTETDDEVVASIGLDPDKITGSGSAAIVVENAKWPVYYATGTRALGLAPVSNFTADLNTGNAPLEVQFFDLSDNAPTSWAWTFEGGTPATSNLQNPAVTYTNGGTFKVTLVATNVYGNHTKTKNGYIVVAGPTGVPTGEIRKPVAYPNPVTDVLHIRDAGAHFTVKVTDMQGKLIRQAENTETIDVSGCKPGLYLLEIRTGESTVRQKILVR